MSEVPLYHGYREEGGGGGQREIIRNYHSLGPYSRSMRRVLGGS